MKNIKFLLMSFLVAAFFVTGSAAAMSHETKPQTEFAKIHVLDFTYAVGTVNQAPQIPFCEISKVSVLPGVELWNFSEQEFVVLNPDKLLENCSHEYSWRNLQKDLQYDTSTSFATSDNPKRKPGSLSRLC